jgi:hypothetical protein
VPALRAVAEGVKGANAEVSQRDGIAEPERTAAQQANQMERDATTKPGLRVADGKHERREDQPDDRVAEAAERPLR